MSALIVLLCSLIPGAGAQVPGVPAEAVTVAPAHTVELTEIPRARWSFGTGLEVRGRQEVNPQYMEAHLLPRFFAQVRFFPYTVAIEAGLEQRETNSGPLSIVSKSTEIGLWGRYEFLRPFTWSPFVGAGMGASFDTVHLNYQDGAAAKSYSGNRKFFGVSAGINHVLWKHILQELETKAVLIEDRRDIAWSAIYRLGFIY